MTLLDAPPAPFMDPRTRAVRDAGEAMADLLTVQVLGIRSQHRELGAAPADPLDLGYLHAEPLHRQAYPPAA